MLTSNNPLWAWVRSGVARQLALIVLFGGMAVVDDRTCPVLDLNEQDNSVKASGAAYSLKEQDHPLEKDEALISLRDTIVTVAGLALSVHRDIEIVAVARTTEDAWQAIQKLKPDLVILDIEIRRETEDAGLKLARQIDDEIEKPPHIVCLSQHKNYADDASECHPVVFLTKPVNPDKLAKYLQWISDHRAERGGTGGCIWVPGKVDGLRGDFGVEPGEILYVETQEERPNFMVIHLRERRITDIHNTLNA
ncbi:MAG: LytR/AlgR family response regulator transcription factor [Methylococcales bacterium]